MKTYFLILSLIVALLLSSQSFASPICLNLFRTENLSYNTIIETLKSELENPALSLLQIREDLFQKNIQKSPDGKVLISPKKMMFLKKHADAVLALLRGGSVNTRELLTSEVLVGEVYSRGAYSSEYYVVRLNGQIHLFPMYGGQHMIYGQQKVSMSALLQPGFLRINKDYIMILGKGEKAGGVFIFSAEYKDPALISMAINQVKDVERRSFLNEFVAELTEILLTTDATIPDFVNAELKVGTIVGTDTKVGYFVAANTQFYLSKNAKQIDPANSKNWGVFEITRPMGFNPRQVVTIEFEGGKRYQVEDGIIKIPVSLEDNSFLLSRNAAHSDANHSLFHKRFSVKYKVEVDELLQKGIIESFDPTALEIIVSTLDSSKKELVYKAKDGHILFKREGGWMFLENIDTTVYGTKFYSSNGSVLKIANGIGFIVQRKILVSPSDNPALNFEAFQTKVDVAIGRATNTAEHTQTLVTLFKNIQEGIQESGLQKSAITPEIISQIQDQVAKQQDVFQKEELSEIIKLIVNQNLFIRQI